MSRSSRTESIRPGDGHRGRQLLLRVLLAVTLCTAGFAVSANDENPGGESEGESSWRWSNVGYAMAVGYGHGMAFRDRQVGRDVADVQILSLNPQLHLVLSQVGDGSRWFDGTWDGLMEGSILINFTPEVGLAGGLSVGPRYRFRPRGRVRPYFESLLGLGWLGFDLEDQDNGISFLINVGIGVQWARWDSVALTSSLRWNHISNGQTHLPNNGIGDLMFMIGIEWR